MRCDLLLKNDIIKHNVDYIINYKDVFITEKSLIYSYTYI